MMPIAVVTGAGAGLGRSIALALSRRSYKVYGTALDQEQTEIDDLFSLSNGNIILKYCDLTKDDEVAEFSKFVVSETKGGVDLLINNAGILTPGPIEVLTMNAIRREFEVNTFGLLRVVNHFLPALRQNRGRLIQVSTLSVDTPSPFNAASAASKTAAEVFTELYQSELSDTGVSFSIAVCGNMKTEGPKKVASGIEKIKDSMSAEMQNIYGESFDKFAQRIMTGQNDGREPDAAAEDIVYLAELKNPPFRVGIGEDAIKVLKN